MYASRRYGSDSSTTLFGVGDRHAVVLPRDLRPHLPIRHQRESPVAPGERGIGEPLPDLLRCGVDVRRVHERAGVHRCLLQRMFQVGQCVDSAAVVAIDPALADLVDGRGVEVVQLLATAPHRRHQVRRFEHREMLADRLPGHVEPLAELGQVLTAAIVQAVEHPPPARIGERLEHRVHRLPVGHQRILPGLLGAAESCSAQRSPARRSGVLGAAAFR